MLYVNPLETMHTSRMDPAAFKVRQEKTALKEFEHSLIYQLISEMRKPTPWGAQADPSGDREIYEDMLNDQLSGAMAESGQLGVAKIVEAQLKTSAESKLATMDAAARMQVEGAMKNN